MFKIIFYPGTHGNYIEFTLNKLLAGNKIEIVNPTGELGTSHNQRTNPNYLAYKTFGCEMLSETSIDNIDPTDYFILVTVNPEDDIFALQLNFKRSEDYNIDPDTIEKDTYHKLYGKVGPGGPLGQGPNKLIDCINQYTDLSPYYNIKDNSWPNVESVNDYWKLPKHILDECTNVFGFNPVCLSDQYPNSPKWVLRTIFNEWFKDRSWAPSVNMSAFDKFNNAYRLNVRKLYNIRDYCQELGMIATHFGLAFNFDYFSEEVHQQFINMVPYKNSSEKCQMIIQAVCDRVDMPFKLNVIEEGYVNFLLEGKFKILMPFTQEEYFKTTDEICTYIDSQLAQNQGKNHQKD